MPDLFLCFAMYYLLMERPLHLIQVEAERSADCVERNSVPPRQSPDSGRVNAEGARQGCSVHQTGVLSGEGIPLMRTIGSGKLDDPSADHAGDPAGSSRAGLTSDMSLWMRFVARA